MKEHKHPEVKLMRKLLKEIKGMKEGLERQERLEYLTREVPAYLRAVSYTILNLKSILEKKPHDEQYEQQLEYYDDKYLNLLGVQHSLKKIEKGEKK